MHQKFVQHVRYVYMGARTYVCMIVHVCICMFVNMYCNSKQSYAQPSQIWGDAGQLWRDIGWGGTNHTIDGGHRAHRVSEGILRKNDLWEHSQRYPQCRRISMHNLHMLWISTRSGHTKEHSPSRVGLYIRLRRRRSKRCLTIDITIMLPPHGGVMRW